MSNAHGAEDKLWKEYQGAIAELFRRHPLTEVEEDVYETGQHSGVKRQLDVRVTLPLKVELAQGIAPTVNVKVVVDAKLWNKRVGLQAVGELASLREDVQAHLLIAVTPLGATRGAQAQGRHNGVFILRATPDLLALLQDLNPPLWVTCVMCERGIVAWSRGLRGVYREPFVAPTLYLEGSCDYCGELHIRCGDCGMVQCLPEDAMLKCPGGCGAVAWVERDPDPKNESREIKWYGALDVALLLAALAARRDRLSERRVDALIDATKWQHWDVASPTIGLTEEGLMEWRGDGFLYITDHGRWVAERIASAEESSWWDLQSLVERAGLSLLLDKYRQGAVPDSQ